MFLINLLRSVIFAVAAVFLIFIQDHSVVLGANVLIVVSALVGFSGLVSIIRKEAGEKSTINLLVSIICLTVAMFLLTSNGFLGLQNTAEDLIVFRLMASVFIATLAISEFALSFRAEEGDRLEFRISAALGILATGIFSFAPLDDVNAVGFLSAYFALSAAQRGIWLATPGKKVRNGKK